MRILVTGGTGFIGSNLVSRLLSEGHDVLATGREGENNLPAAVPVFKPKFLGDLDWKEIGPIDVLFHEAANNDTTFLDEKEMFRANVEASDILFHRAFQNGCRRIIYASSTAIYGDAPAPYREGATPLNPLNPYGKSKKLLEEFAAQFTKEHSDVIVVGLRYCNVYGPGESHKGKRASMIYQLAQQMKIGNPRIFKHGEQKRDYIYVADVVRANLLASEAKKNCVVNCGFGRATTFNDLIAILNEVMETNRTPEYIENPYADKYQNYTECDMALTKEKIGFVPEFDLRKGIRAYFNSGFLMK